jgi:hypothetical protein
VRCGACQQVFDGNASLVELDALAPRPAGAAPPAEPRGPEPEPQALDAVVPEADDDEIPVFTLDFNAALDPLGILPGTDSEARPADGAKAAADEADLLETVTVEIDLSEAETPHNDTGNAEQAHDQAQDIEQAEAHEPQAGHGEAADTGSTDSGHAEPAGIEFIAAEPPAETAQSDSAGAQADSVEHKAQPDNQSKPGFSMGSALLAEPGEPTHNGSSGLAAGTRIEPSFELPVEEELVAAALPHDHEAFETDLHARAEAMARAAAGHAPLPLRESADDGRFAAEPATAKPPRSRLTGRRSKLTPTRIAPPKLRVPEIDEPDFVKRGRQREQSGKRTRILMAAGSVLLLLLLAAQAAATFSNVLAARFPAMKPALGAACALLRCRIELPARIDNLAIETGELQTVGENTYVLTTLLHNQGNLAQAWPDIELALTDANDKPLVRRVFAPAEYLPKGVAAAGFAARAEQPVKLYFQLDQLKPSGYHIAVFYP